MEIKSGGSDLEIKNHKRLDNTLMPESLNEPPPATAVT
jgi:hypothetical protein